MKREFKKKLERTEFNVAQLRRICFKNGATRVGEDVPAELATVLQRLADRVVREALNYMMWSKRITLYADDVKAASDKMFFKGKTEPKWRVEW